MLMRDMVQPYVSTTGSTFTYLVGGLVNITAGQRLAVSALPATSWPCLHCPHTVPAACLPGLQGTLQQAADRRCCAQIRGARGNHAIAAFNSQNIMVANMYLHTAGIFAFLDSSCANSTYMVSGYLQGYLCMPTQPSAGGALQLPASMLCCECHQAMLRTHPTFLKVQQSSGGLPVQNNSLTPRPTLYPGTTRGPLLSGAADGIHIAQASAGCVSMSDDGHALLMWQLLRVVYAWLQGYCDQHHVRLWHGHALVLACS